MKRIALTMFSLAVFLALVLSLVLLDNYQGPVADIITIVIGGVSALLAVWSYALLVLKKEQ